MNEQRGHFQFSLGRLMLLVSIFAVFLALSRVVAVLAGPTVLVGIYSVLVTFGAVFLLAAAFSISVAAITQRSLDLMSWFGNNWLRLSRHKQRNVMGQNRYPKQWRDRVPAQVFACLLPGELRLTLLPEAGLADGGYPLDVPMDRVPADLRMPNTKVWVRFDKAWQVQKVWRREEE